MSPRPSRASRISPAARLAASWASVTVADRSDAPVFRVCEYAQPLGAGSIRGPAFDAARDLLAANASALLVANLAHRRVVEPWVDRTVGPEDSLSVGGVYEQRHAARRIHCPAFNRREVSRLRSDAPCMSAGARPAATSARSSSWPTTPKTCKFARAGRRQPQIGLVARPASPAQQGRGPRALLRADRGSDIGRPGDRQSERLFAATALLQFGRRSTPADGGDDLTQRVDLVARVVRPARVAAIHYG